jgi:hypothetical protein
MGLDEALLCEGWPAAACIACVHVPLLAVVFVGLSLVCDEHLVPAIEHMCGRLAIPPQAAAASFLAFATAAPEIVINIIATTSGRVEISLSAILGSAIIAYGLIPALCCIAGGSTMRLRTSTLARDSLFFAGTLGLLTAFIDGGELDLLECSALCGCFTMYMVAVFVPVVRPANSKARLGDAVAAEEAPGPPPAKAAALSAAVGRAVQLVELAAGGGGPTLSPRGRSLAAAAHAGSEAAALLSSSAAGDRSASLVIDIENEGCDHDSSDSGGGGGGGGGGGDGGGDDAGTGSHGVGDGVGGEAAGPCSRAVRACSFPFEVLFAWTLPPPSDGGRWAASFSISILHVSMLSFVALKSCTQLGKWRA